MTKRKAVRAAMPVFVAVDSAGVPIWVSAFRSVVEEEVRSDVVHVGLVVQTYVPRDRHAERVPKELAALGAAAIAYAADQKTNPLRTTSDCMARQSHISNIAARAVAYAAAYEKARRK